MKNLKTKKLKQYQSFLEVEKEALYDKNLLKIKVTCKKRTKANEPKFFLDNSDMLKEAEASIFNSFRVLHVVKQGYISNNDDRYLESEWHFALQVNRVYPKKKKKQDKQKSKKRKLVKDVTKNVENREGPVVLTDSSMDGVLVSPSPSLCPED